MAGGLTGTFPNGPTSESKDSYGHFHEKESHSFVHSFRRTGPNLCPALGELTCIWAHLNWKKSGGQVRDQVYQGGGKC